jgi:hypothetical protein
VNKKLKEQIKSAFDAPEPLRKNEFLQSINFSKTNRLDFILGQIGYIRKRVWIISCLLFVLALFVLRTENNFNLVWLISSVLPFVSLLTTTEIARSASYNMAELEMSCKYNFAGVILTRLGILSFFNLLLFGLIIILFSGEIGFGVLRTGLYMLVPFMLTCSLSLFTLNRLRSRETIYICGVISCFTGISNALFTTQYSRAFSSEYMLFWGGAFIILVICAITETIKLIRKTEEMQWNL